MIEDCLLHEDLQVRTATFLYKMYFFLSNLKNTIENPKFYFITIIIVIILYYNMSNTKKI